LIYKNPTGKLVKSEKELERGGLYGNKMGKGTTVGLKREIFVHELKD